MSLSNDFEKRIKAILGDEFEQLEEALEREPVRAIRLNPLRLGDTSANKASIILDKTSANLEDEILWEPTGYSFNSGTPGKHPYHEAGVYYIQEPSAMSPVSFLNPQPGEKVLDLCAAPGGKSTQIACRMKGKGILVANEIDRKRAQTLSLNVERLGIRNALVTNMKPEMLSEIFEGYFDRILVDAPCSGEGMFRKNDEAIDNWSEDNVELCAKRQTDILKYAVKMLAPGGRLVYSTCTFAPEEDELQVGILIQDGLKPVSIELYDGMVPGDIANIQKVRDIVGTFDFDEYISFQKQISSEINEAVKKCTARLWPHKIKGEGHFLAVFEKEGDISLNHGNYGINGNIKPVKETDIKPFMQFADENIKEIDITKDQKGFVHIQGCISGNPFLFGDQLYLAPDGMPGIRGLTVLRPGLHLGTIKKDRFEPSHALALAITTEDVRYSYELHDTSKAMQFIGGMSFREPGLSNGWYLITFDGYSLGWSKYAGGSLKNHYPKGLRIYT
ncbi:RsmF rRNA methyltransferase first C-terminal domain-containing protein [Butyrivibrio sp. INlla16]|uniref:RsmF rRNA methyltransferase first C-terminal domain-containing protein n=1 Tax=Butyrivibrio sp. INlla16 TaxID=1520807 RepID=UPI000889BD39|nr:RsmF rRNA methyltransferase first C-terminal domain-containing protein [Butyrivibrio sp. INlla16]SDB38736.1 NOL1/NOP2/sun family putative RNA methylase [Butyrivibrio sp. INlla16]